MGFLDKLSSAIFDSPEVKATKLVEVARLEVALDKFMAESEIRYKIESNGKVFEKPHEIYRYVYRRCKVLEYLLSNGAAVGSDISSEDIKIIEQYAVEHYYKYCPETLYGQAALKLTIPMINKLMRSEKLKIDELLNKKKSNAIIDGFIYLGISSGGKRYIGKTTRSPERRYLEHREFSSGPYKLGHSHVEWKIIHTCKASELDHWESYFIGFHNSYENGLNENRGNLPPSYDQGKIANKSSVDTLEAP